MRSYFKPYYSSNSSTPSQGNKNDPMWAVWPTTLCVCALFWGRNDFLLCRVVGLAAFIRAGAVLGFGFNLRLGKLGFVEQVVDLSVQQSQLRLDVFGQQNGALLWRAFLLFCYRLILPSLQKTETISHMKVRFFDTRWTTRPVIKCLLSLWKDHSTVWQNNPDEVIVTSSGLSQFELGGSKESNYLVTL